jgi:hypothetical protein
MSEPENKSEPKPSNPFGDDDTAAWWLRVLADPVNKPEARPGYDWRKDPHFLEFCELIADALIAKASRTDSTLAEACPPPSS